MRQFLFWRKKVLLFDGHSSYIIFEFLSIYLRQSLDGLSFLNYKQHFRRENTCLPLWSGSIYSKTEFLSTLNRIREKALTPRIIKRVFTDRGIFPTPTNESKVVASLESQLPPVSELYISGYTWPGRETPPPGDPTSSSIASTSSKSIEQIWKKKK